MPDLVTMATDAEAVYDERIAPLMTEIIGICREHKIPVLATFQWCDDTHEDGAGFCTTFIPFAGMASKLTECKDHLMAKPMTLAFRITDDGAK